VPLQVLRSLVLPTLRSRSAALVRRVAAIPRRSEGRGASGPARLPRLSVEARAWTERTAVRFALCLLPVGGVWLWFVDGVLRATGGVPCPILDDAFILFQYARSFARFEPLAYHPGEPPTTGATSILSKLIENI
jgi:hypothetical protein